MAPGVLAASAGWSCRAIAARAHAPMRRFASSSSIIRPGAATELPKKKRRTWDEAGKEALAKWEARDKAKTQAAAEPPGSSGYRPAGGAVVAAQEELYSMSAPTLDTGALSGKLRAPPTPIVYETSSEPLSLSSEVVWLYRVTLRHVRVITNSGLREIQRQDTQKQFREMQQAAAAADKEAVTAAPVTPTSTEGAGAAAAAAAAAASSSSSSASPTPAAASSLFPADARARKLLSAAYSRLSFLRMSTPKLRQPRLTRVPAYLGARTLFGNPDDGPALYGEGGERMTEEQRAQALAEGRAVGGRNVFNSQGVTDEQRKRHHGLVERMNFRGPHWAGKSKY